MACLQGELDRCQGLCEPMHMLDCSRERLLGACHTAVRYAQQSKLASVVSMAAGGGARTRGVAPGCVTPSEPINAVSLVNRVR